MCVGIAPVFAEIAQSSVAKYMVKRPGPPSQGWRTFLRNHAPDIAAMDLFIAPTIGFDLLYCLHHCPADPPRPRLDQRHTSSNRELDRTHCDVSHPMWVPVCFVAEEATMRMIALVLLALIGMSLTSTDADAGAWCANYRRGVSNCGYATQEQCLAQVWGLGGGCRPNPFPGTAYGTSAGSWNTPDSFRRYRRAY